MELSGAMATNADIHPNSHPLPHQKERESDTTLIKMEAGNNRRSRGGGEKHSFYTIKGYTLPAMQIKQEMRRIQISVLCARR